MKSIKCIISITLLLGAIVSSAQTNYDWYYNGILIETATAYTTPDVVHTPNTTDVSVARWLSGIDWTQNTKNQMVSHWQSRYGGRLILEADATIKYFCHSWAWATRQDVVMISPKEENYIDDGSYVDAGTITAADIVWFGSNTHSAKKISSTYLSSKWDYGPRFKHLVNDCPNYVGQNLYYYKLGGGSPPTPAINGGGTVCYSGNSFFLSNAPANDPIYWTVSNPALFSLSNTSGLGTSVTVTRIGSANGSATLKAHIDVWQPGGSPNGTINRTEIASTSISACPLALTGPSSVMCGQTVQYYMTLIPGATYTWSSQAGTMTCSYPYPTTSNSMTFYVPPPYVLPGGGSDIITCKVTVNGVDTYYYIGVVIND